MNHDASIFSFQSFDGSSNVPHFVIPHRLRSIQTHPIMNIVVFDFFITSKAFNLLYFIDGTFFISFKLVSQDNNNIFDFGLDKLKSLFDLILPC